ncbi:UDP-N-acetylmuramyl-tripeptide synthetase [Patescibacteria group bacterium]|nr:UDP-N-acetylmuramyl-tripeptide synthetase [Patescibacteria group bacterium]
MSILIFLKKYIPKKLFKTAQPAYHFILSWAAAVFYGHPSKKLIIIGVTGTTGKTTTVYLMHKILKAAGYKIGCTSTAMFSDGEKEWLNDKKMTMVGRFWTQKMLRNMLRNKCHYAIIETTSEGIKQFRHYFIHYDILVFTGLYEEHIEAHGNFENYKKTKGKLFAHLKKCCAKYVNKKRELCNPKTGIQKIELEKIKKTIIVNADDQHADYFLDFWSEQKYQFTINNYELQIKNKVGVGVIVASNIKSNGSGVSFVVNNTEINLQLLGAFNVVNAMAGVCVGLSQGVGMQKIKQGLENIKTLPGRLEKIDQGQNFTVIVDYAFEPNAVEKLYETIKFIKHNKIIHILGSTGGGRDVDRRPKLGKIAGEKADYVIITNEDPYDEDPQIIIDQVAVGTEYAGKEINKNLFKILDRRQAIKKALALAQKNDIVLITGKGCEQAICVANGEKIKWDDREVAREELYMNRNSVPDTVS